MRVANLHKEVEFSGETLNVMAMAMNVEARGG